MMTSVHEEAYMKLRAQEIEIDNLEEQNRELRHHIKALLNYLQLSTEQSITTIVGTQLPLSQQLRQEANRIDEKDNIIHQARVAVRLVSETITITNVEEKV